MFDTCSRCFTRKDVFGVKRKHCATCHDKILQVSVRAELKHVMSAANRFLDLYKRLAEAQQAVLKNRECPDISYVVNKHLEELQ